MNGVGSCSVDIFNLESSRFFKDSTFDIGEIDQIITVNNEEILLFVVKTKLNTKCDDSTGGTIIWQYTNDTMLVSIRNIIEIIITQLIFAENTKY